MNAIDLFAGCGGLSKGFQDAGFHILLGVDNNEPALRTFAFNHKGSKTLNADLSDKKSFDTIREIINNQKVDLIIAGPPCQGFSMAGKRIRSNASFLEDERNYLFKEYIRK